MHIRVFALFVAGNGSRNTKTRSTQCTYYVHGRRSYYADLNGPNNCTFDIAITALFENYVLDSYPILKFSPKVSEGEKGCFYHHISCSLLHLSRRCGGRWWWWLKSHSIECLFHCHLLWNDGLWSASDPAISTRLYWCPSKVATCRDIRSSFQVGNFLNWRGIRIRGNRCFFASKSTGNLKSGVEQFLNEQMACFL